MMSCRKRIKELENKLEICKDLIECYRGDRDMYRTFYEDAKIAVDLLNEDQRWEYYRLLSERDEEMAKP